MLFDLIRYERRMIAAHNDLLAPAAELIGNEIRTLCRIGFNRDQHDIRIGIVIDALDPVVKKLPFTIRRQKST